MSKELHPKDQGERAPVVVRDLRRNDPVTLRARRRQDAKGPVGSGPAGVSEARSESSRADPADATRLRERIAELTEDLQRVKAEYDNYRKRVRRDRLAIREIAVVNVLTGLLPVLDAVDDARRQDDGNGAVEVISGVLQERLAALGLRTVGAAGEPFDPDMHEACTYHASGAAQEAVCTAVLRHGYRVGDHLLRPAQVAVAGPAPAA
ncbi:nucleotide exchange factor GrpE [Streptomyces sp. NPDC002785]|uniref:nucleotide exchange factor GrpE n=1 Tax=Streptomyces sp. NPDC002785 TaxID=3154543 RepID=UPI00331C4F42